MSYKAIGFDYGGVLNGMTGTEFVTKIVDVLGITREQYNEAYFRYNKRLNLDEITWADLWKLVLADLGQPDKFNEVMAVDDTRGKDALNIEVVALAKRLKANGYRIGILSNNQVDAQDRFHAQGLDEIFEIIHVSAITGYVKPDPKGFELFAKDLGVAPAELIFIDDAQKSLSTAAEVGYTPILFENYQQLLGDLKNLGIHV